MSLWRWLCKADLPDGSGVDFYALTPGEAVREAAEFARMNWGLGRWSIREPVQVLRPLIEDQATEEGR